MKCHAESYLTSVLHVLSPQAMRENSSVVSKVPVSRELLFRYHSGCNLLDNHT